MYIITHTFKIGGSQSKTAKVVVKLMNSMGNVVATNLEHVLHTRPGCSTRVMGTFPVSNPALWWPWTMSDTPGHLYVLQVYIPVSSQDVAACYYKKLFV